MAQPVGRRLFAQYAHAPNALGYCGPAGAAGLRAVAMGAGDGVDVAALARQFSGAWPYQVVLAELAGIEDPLDATVVRGYWTGNDLTAEVDRHKFGTRLLDRIRPQAGHYWQHLTDELLSEAAPTHAFHVLSVYPWSRLLNTGRPEPLEVLDSCRITPARVVEVGDDLLVEMRHLQFADGRLTLGESVVEKTAYRIDGKTFCDPIDVDSLVAVHWGFACDRLTPAEAERLDYWTDWQLGAISPRLADRSLL